MYNAPMIDVAKFFIDHLLSLPVVVFAICIIFRKQVQTLLDVLIDFLRQVKQVSVKHKDTCVEASVEATTQTVQAEEGESESGLGSFITTTPADKEVAINLEIERTQIENFGKDMVSTPYKVQAIKTELERLGYALGETNTTDILIRQLATSQLYIHFERTYRLVFGSQIKLLDTLQLHGPLIMVIVRLFYDSAVQAEQEFYADYPFESWCKFMASNYLIEINAENDTYSITSVGRDFLVWMLTQRLSRDKAC